MPGKRREHPTAAPIASQALVDEAKAALERLAAASPVGQVAYSSIEELGQAWGVTTLTIGVSGTPAARLELFDALARGALAGLTRTPGAPPLHVLAGPSTRFSAHHADGTVEQRTLPTRRATTDEEGEAALVASAEAARRARAERAAQVDSAEQVLPAVIRARPPRWAFWRWLARWILTLVAGKKIATRDRAVLALGAADQQVVAADRAVEAHRERALEPARRFRERLHELCAGGGSAAKVRHIELEILDSPVPPGVVVVELLDPAGADRVDRVVEVADRVVHVDGAGGRLRWVGDLAGAAADFPALATDGRAARIARSAIATIRDATRSLEEMLDGVEADYRARVGRLEVLRVPDPAAFAAAELERVRPQIHASLNAILEHALAHFGSELAQLAAGWTAVITAASAGDELKAAVTRVDEEWTTQVTRVADEVRLLVMGGVGGSACDLQPELLSALRAHGLAEQHLARPRAAPVLPAIELLPTMAGAGSTKLGGGNWLSALFRSLEGRRAEVLENLQQRIKRLDEVARAEMFDAEPRLHAALAGVLAAALDAALRTQAAWLDEALADEGHAIARDRLQQAPLIELRDMARDDTRRLTEMTIALELGESGPER